MFQWYIAWSANALWFLKQWSGKLYNQFSPNEQQIDIHV